MNVIVIGDFRRISKTTAMRLYREGKTVYIIPCKMRPDNMYIPAIPIMNEIPIHSSNDESNVNAIFRQRVIASEYYNCNHETGYYSAFYIKKEA